MKRHLKKQRIGKLDVVSMSNAYEERKKKYLVKKPLLYGLMSSLALIGLYFIILTFANSFQHAIQEFIKMWYWILLLVIGFGIQISLYVYVRGFIKVRNIVGINESVVATGSISTTSMVACCVHHLTDVIPILGLSAVAIFLDKYQLLFIVIGILSNLIGIIGMLRIIQKHGLHIDDGFISLLMKKNMKKFFSCVLSFSFLVISIMLILGG